MAGVSRLVASLLYGSGLRIGECLALRVKDVDVAERIITVRGGKGDKDRMTILAELMVAPLMEQLGAVRSLHARDLASRSVVVPLPNALGRKFPGAARDFSWQWLFPASRLVTRSSEVTERELGQLTLPGDGIMVRWHLHPSVVQRNVAQEVRGLESRSERAATRFVIRSRCICWRRATTYEQFSS